MAKKILIWLLVAASGWAAEVVPVLDANGKRYRDVKFGPVNQDQIVLFHSTGVITVPVASLPAEYQTRFAPKQVMDALPVPREVPEVVPPPITLPPPPAPPAPPDPAAVLEAMRAKRLEPASTGGNSDWARYNRERATIVLLDGKLVKKESLKPLIGFLAHERAQLKNGTRVVSGAMLDLAERKNEEDKVAAVMELRPALWHRTEERVFLLNYNPMSLLGAVMKIYVVEVEPVDQMRTFKVGTEPSFEDWKRLPRQ